MTAAQTVLISGATASGKSKFALALAERTNGCIINADSMQVYAELRILTARPTPEDEARVPHLLYGHVPAREAYSAGRFVADAGRAISAALGAGRRPIVVGGTGLYFKALLEGLSPVPVIPADIRKHWRAQALRLGAAVLHETLARRDAETAARLNPADTQRIVRALEVLDASGKGLAYWQAQPSVPVVREAEAVKYLLEHPREELQARADVRFEAMLREGALEEVRALLELRLDPALPTMRALGVRPLTEHLRGRARLQEAAERAKAETRQYIKRQETWFRRHMISWNRIIEQ